VGGLSLRRSARRKVRLKSLDQTVAGAALVLSNRMIMSAVGEVEIELKWIEMHNTRGRPDLKRALITCVTFYTALSLMYSASGYSYD
jgi:hypothetical protein